MLAIAHRATSIAQHPAVIRRVQELYASLHQSDLTALASLQGDQLPSTDRARTRFHESVKEAHSKLCVNLLIAELEVLGPEKKDNLSVQMY